jgi:hypothetical protein
VAGVRCPGCAGFDDKVIDSRTADDGAAIRRRRECLTCGRRFTTYERLEEAPLVVRLWMGEGRVHRLGDLRLRPLLAIPVQPHEFLDVDVGTELTHVQVVVVADLGGVAHIDSRAAGTC